MNEHTLMNSLKTELVAQTWTGSSNVVFPSGSVAVVPDLDLAMEAALKTMRTPFALMKLEESTSDPDYDEDPNFVRLGVKVRLAVTIPGDAVGENAVMGANKTGGSTKSEGRGLLELEQELHNAIGKVNAKESIVLQCRQKGATGGAVVEGKLNTAFRDYTFEGFGTVV